MVTAATGAFLRVVFNLEEDQVPIRRARIKDRLALAGPTVTQMAARLNNAGLISATDDEPILALTDRGREIAVRVVRKHRLAERLFTDVLGLSPQLAHREAAAWEHALGGPTEQAIVALLDDPARSPWGNPIPGLDELGASTSPVPASINLTALGPTADPVVTAPHEATPHEAAPHKAVVHEAVVHEAVVHSISEAGQDDAEFAASLMAAGILPGETITVHRIDERFTLHGRASLDLPLRTAQWILLER